MTGDYFDPLAQLDSALGCEPRGPVFESRKDHHYGCVGESGRPRFPVTEKIAGPNPAVSARFVALDKRFKSSFSHSEDRGLESRTPRQLAAIR